MIQYWIRKDSGFDMNIYYVKAEHTLLPKVSQYVPEYKFDEFTRALHKADYQNVDITLITERGQKV